MLLAVAVGNEIKIYSPHRVDAIGLYFNISKGHVWNVITVVRLSEDLGTVSGAIGRCVAWMNNGLLVFATDREITCYSKWLRDETASELDISCGQLMPSLTGSLIGSFKTGRHGPVP